VSKAKPKKYVPSCSLAKIAHRKLSAWEERDPVRHPAFDTWGEAHNYMIQRAETKAKRAMKELAYAQSKLLAVCKMGKPESAP
jgi:hypothetical protein